MSLLRSFPLLIALLIFVVMLPSILEKFSQINDGVNSECYTNICIKHSIDYCNKSIDLGWESVGFLSSEHFYYCDGIKITNKCLEYKEVRDNRSGLNLNMRCEVVGDKRT